MADSSSRNKLKRFNLRDRYSTSTPAKRVRITEKDEPETSVSVHLIDINTDCLFEIFRYMSLIDLCHLAEVCKTLKTAAQQFFSWKYTRLLTKTFELLPMLQGKHTTLTQTRSLLYNFGELIECLQVSPLVCGESKRLTFKMLKLISKYCTGLRELSLYMIVIKSDNGKWKQLLVNVNSLTLTHCVIYDASYARKNLLCTNLRYLKMAYTKYVNFKKLTTLETIELNHCTVNGSDFTKLIQRNTNLCKLSIVQCPLLNKINFKEISHLKYLKEIELNQNLNYKREMQFEMEIQPLSESKTLEKLSLTCGGRSVSSLISNLVIKSVPIQYLHLTNTLVDDQMIESIARLKLIKTLKLGDAEDLKSEHLIKLANELTSLVELDTNFNATCETLCEILSNSKQLTCFRIGSMNLQINHQLYNQLLDIITKRSQESNINLTIYGEGGHITVPTFKINANAEILNISEREERSWVDQNMEVDLDTGDELDDYHLSDSEWDPYSDYRTSEDTD